jgi:dienelactone hydrolase
MRRAGTDVAARAVRYRHEDTALTGEIYVAGPDPRPAVLLIHGGAGLDGHARDQSKRYAATGYCVLACDMYGEDVQGDRAKIMSMLSRLREDHDFLARRAQSALDVLAGQPEASRTVAAIGYCFGGMAALALARAGASLDGVVSFHGSLATPTPAGVGAIGARLLVCHGAADPHVPLTDVTAFVEEMNRAEADWQLNIYGGAMHGFTHRHATPGETPGVAYQREADQRSFDDAQRFLASLTSGTPAGRPRIDQT